MRACWVALHESLVRAVGGVEAEVQFQKQQEQQTALARFETPSALLDYLQDETGSLDEKYVLYAALIELVQRRGAGAKLAMSLVWLGLWPALGGIFRRRLRLFPNDPEALLSELGGALTALVESTNLSRVRRVVARLVRGTDRDIGRWRRRAWKEAAELVAEPGESDLGVVEPVEPPSRRSLLGLKDDLPEEDEVAAIRARLLPILGDDVDLVIGAVIHGENQRRLAERLGLSYEATRKRIQRALLRLREHLGRP